MAVKQGAKGKFSERVDVDAKWNMDKTLETLPSVVEIPVADFLQDYQ